MRFRSNSCLYYVALGTLCLGPAVAQGQPAKGKAFPPVSDAKIARYTAYRRSSPLRIDGQLMEHDWHVAPRSPRFRDLVGGTRTIHATHAAVLWDDEYLYVAYWIEDPFVRAKFEQRDQPIYRDNDVELFIAGDNAYYEFEINALGTIYEGLFIWQSAYQRHQFRQLPGLDRKDPQVRSQRFNGVGLKQHPRGLRWAFLGWDLPGLRSAVAVDGTLNQDDDRDRGWTVELAIPFRGLASVFHGGSQSLPPDPGDQWRIDFSRFNQFKEAAPAKDSGGWAWSPHGVWDSHVPEVFPKITFSAQLATEAPADAPANVPAR